ncbi:hypothetical protein BJX96DRAFT_174218 [Aspergillus floccosus]
MGWVGVATLIATACYLLYRFPPSTWTPEPVPPSAPVEPSTAELPRSTAIKDATSKSARSALNALEDEEDTEETQTTPKASASNAPALEVPTLNLGNESNAESPSEAPAIQSVSASPAASIPISATASATNGVENISPPNILMPPPTAPSQPSSSGSSSSLMPPPPPPRLRPTLQQQPSSLLAPPRAYPPRPKLPTGSNTALRPPPSAAANARARPSSGLAPPATPSVKPANNASKRAVLEPGYSPLDWAALTANPKHNLRGANVPPHPIRVTPSMLKAQNGRKGTDAWTSYQGKVYNITPYLPFHPGGKGELLRGAGKDSGQLFFEIHPWVNWDAILGEYLDPS